MIFFIKITICEIYIYYSLKQRNLNDTKGRKAVEGIEDILNHLHYVYCFSMKENII